jgi:DNA-binding NarL/FixJ family response regulator
MKISVVILEATSASPASVLVEHGHEVTETAGLETLRGGSPPGRPDCLVLVSRRCGKALLEAVSLVIADAANSGIVVVCDRIGGNEARSLLAAGAGGLVISREASRTLLPTIEAVRAGQVCVPRRQAPQAERPGLSTREKQVIGLVALGFSNGEIADRLFLAESTVKSHLSSAFAKLGVRSRHEAVELIMNPASGLASGIMSLGAEPIEALGTEIVESP